MPGASLLTTTLDHVEGMYMREDHAHKKPRAQKPHVPLGARPMHLCGMCKCLCPETLWMNRYSDCSIIIPEHVHIHGHMDTVQHNIEGMIIYYIHVSGPRLDAKGNIALSERKLQY